MLFIARQSIFAASPGYPHHSPFSRCGADAQAGGAKLMVAVSDPSGAVIPEATVTVLGLDEATEGRRQSRPARPRRTDRSVAKGSCPAATRSARSSRGSNRAAAGVRVNRRRQQARRRPAAQEHGGIGHRRRRQSGGRSRPSRAFGLNVTQEQIQALSDDPAEMAAAVERHRRPRRDLPRRQLRGPAAAAQVADQVDPRHARSVRGRDRAARIDVRRRHHAARRRADSRRRELVVPRRLDERQEPVHADQGAGADRAATASTSAARWSSRRAISRCRSTGRASTPRRT